MATLLVYMCIVGGLAVATLRWPAVAIAAVLCTFSLEQWAQARHVFFMEHSVLTNLATAGIVGLALVRQFFAGERVLGGYPKIGWVIMALFAWTFASYLWTIAPTETAEQLRKAFPYIIALILLGPLVIRDWHDAQKALTATVIVGSIILLLLLTTTHWRGRSIVLAGWGLDLGSPLAIGQLAGYVGISAVLLNFGRLGPLWTVLRWGVAAVALFAALRTGSRGQFFGMVIVALAFIPVSRNIRNVRSFAFLAVSLMLFSVMSYWVFQTIAGESQRYSLAFMIQDYYDSRFLPLQDLLGTWIASPFHWVLGLGSSASYKVIGFYPHFVPGEILAEEGLVGFALFIAMVVITARNFLRLFRSYPAGSVAASVVATVSALFCYELLLSFKQASMLISFYLFTFAIILGRIEWAARHEELYTEEEVHPFDEETHATNPELSPLASN